MEISIALEKPCYFPGEVLKCLIKVGALWFCAVYAFYCYIAPAAA
jgi:hypothetical protein